MSKVYTAMQAGSEGGPPYIYVSERDVTSTTIDGHVVCQTFSSYQVFRPEQLLSSREEANAVAVTLLRASLAKTVAAYEVEIEKFAPCLPSSSTPV